MPLVILVQVPEEPNLYCMVVDVQGLTYVAVTVISSVIVVIWVGLLVDENPETYEAEPVPEIVHPVNLYPSGPVAVKTYFSEQ